MNLIVDAGNTTVKTAFFNEWHLAGKTTTPRNRFLDEILLLYSQKKIRHSLLASVTELGEEETRRLRQIQNLMILNAATPLPFSNCYSSPETLGVDRMALAAAAVSLYPGKNVLSIDAGTCITYDFTNTKKEYLGGAITPGLFMRYRALNRFTAKLPLLKPQYAKQLVGDSTTESIHSGIVSGLIGEIDAFITAYRSTYPDLIVVLTGGDANFLAKRLKNSIFAKPNFLIEGLNSILIYNLNL